MPRRPLWRAVAAVAIAAFAGLFAWRYQARHTLHGRIVAAMPRLSVPLPTPLVVEPGRARYRIAATELESPTPTRGPESSSYRLANARVVSFGTVSSSCGSTSNIGAHGAAFLLYFAPRPSEAVVVALAADRLGRIAHDGTTRRWDPASLRLTPTHAMGPLCAVAQVPKSYPTTAGGVPAICATANALGNCSIEVRDGGALWMAEIYAADDAAFVAAEARLRRFALAHRASAPR